MKYNHLRNVTNSHRHRDTQRVAFLEQRKEVRMRTVKELTPTGTMVKMRTKPIKDIYVRVILGLNFDFWPAYNLVILHLIVVYQKKKLLILSCH